MNDEARVIHDINVKLALAGLNANIVVRDLDSRREISTATDSVLPIASVVKVPIALALLTRICEGALDGAQSITIEPERFDTAGQTGTSRFHHPAQIALDDLVMLSVCFSDNSATDALLDIVTPDEIQSDLERLGVRGIHVRHHLGGLLQTPLESLPESEAHLAYELARSSPSPGAGHRIWQLDVSQANVGTAEGLTELLQEIWRPTRIDPTVASRLRSLMSGNIIRHRLAPDFVSDATTWSSKTGTLLNLRHEIGVVDYADGQSIAVTALSESSNPASAQPAAEAALGAAARALHDLLR